MKNYLARLGLPRKATGPQITDAIAEAMDYTSDTQSVLDAETILTEKVTRAYYERTHLQYEAISAALDCLLTPGALDSHRWAARTVEFDTSVPEDAQGS
ncbi:hypothetical protein [Granulosicoccus antarcticus]|uniref:Uncharacterized protein n=1 Tax=Granulosicoccus antarcticus IMCC3135 TaxID=1192854 RepID=A0A2Z2NYJ2_9GAMM|nr:hypothetical protein [Granulosicoccus antarcticus]ASJ76383.1 hypothetical protein IMCC3135_31680 [Granulosicoccus antarcticus IMCC3135]